MNQENRGDNLYTRIHRLLVTDQYAEAEQMLDEHLSRDPSSREGILSWTELKLILVRTVCILLLATTEAGISEAWPVAVRLACNHREISEAWNKKNLVPLFSRFCFEWMGIETRDGTKIGPWSTN